jgi:transposase-like protein
MIKFNIIEGIFYGKKKTFNEWMNTHLGYETYKRINNSRNGKKLKSIRSKNDEIEIDVLQD